ncbi:MAG: L-aspartate oxidase [Planctomycetaceae bacterium]|nr:L-aspartate oxidase [Planctomycetaceae bacterium]
MGSTRTTGERQNLRRCPPNGTRRSAEGPRGGPIGGTCGARGPGTTISPPRGVPWDRRTIALQSRSDLVLDRALVAFEPQDVPFYRFDVLVLGGGAAGCTAALAAAQAGCSVALLSKAELEESNTLYAQGGVAAVFGPKDSFASHAADTLELGCGLCDPAVVERVVRGGPDAVQQLLALGAEFDRDGEGKLALSLEGGHEHARVLHARGDSTGQEIQRALVRGVHGHPGIHLFPRTFAIDLLRDGDGRVCGLLALTARAERVGFLAPEVVLATGGAGQIYRETTNPSIATGDGVALAFRAGATLRDLEFFQFHPTCLYIAGAARVLISEIVRGAGGVLRDRHGRRFMPDFHRDGELAPRDVVSRAVFATMVATDDTSVYLDLSHIESDVHTMFPSISRICGFFGIDIARDPVPVRPGQHYMVGGIRVDADGRTDVPGLWAVGECASSGLHGANRMGSNSLLEGLVLGQSTGTAAAAAASMPRRDLQPMPHVHVRALNDGLRVNVEDLTYSLKSLMWRQMGVVRDRAKLEDAFTKIALWTRAVRELAPEDVRTYELLNMLTVSRLAVLGALGREESRGVHFRSDFPQSAEAWRAHTDVRGRGDGLKFESLELLRAPVGDSRPVDAAIPALRP